MPPEKVLDEVVLPALEFHDVEHLVDPLLRELAVKVVEVGVELQVLVGREAGIERRVLKDEADGGPDLVGILCAVVSGDLGGSAGG